MRSAKEKAMKVAAFSSSLSGHLEYVPTIASVTTLLEDAAMWGYVNGILIEMYTRLHRDAVHVVRKMTDDSEYLASSSHKNKTDPRHKRGSPNGLKCHTCG